MSLYEQMVANMAADKIRHKVLDVSVDGKTLLITDGVGHPRYVENTHGLGELGVHEIPVTYLRQYHHVAGSVPQGLVVVVNGKPEASKWRRLSLYSERVA